MAKRLKVFWRSALLLALAVVLVPIIVLPFLDRVYYRGPPTDHFDGSHFFNPSPADQPHASWTEFMARRLGGEPAQWPVSIPVIPTVPPRSVDGSGMRVTMVGHAVDR